LVAKVTVEILPLVPLFTGLHLRGVRLMGVHFMGVHLKSVNFMGVHLINMYLVGVLAHP
jgi:hypothetical protein